MGLPGQVLTQLGGVASIVVIVICGVVVVFRQTITEWLRRRVTRGLDEAADRYKHELSLQSEAYKAELARMQSVERYRFDVRKAVADKILEQRIEAFKRYHAPLDDTPSRILANLASAHDIREPVHTAYTMIRDMQAVQYVHGLAVPLAFRMQWNQVIQTMHTLVVERWEQPATLSLDAPECVDLQRNCAELANQLDAMLSSLPNELANTVVSPPAAI